MDVRQYNYTVTSQDVDFISRAKFSSLICSLLNTAGEDARRNGFGIAELSRHNIGWVLSRLALEVDRRPVENEDYVVETWVTEYTPLRTTRCFRLLDGEGNCFGRAVSYWCLLDYTNRRLAPMDLLKEVADTSVTNVPLPCDAPMKLRPFQAEPCSSHKVKYMDIDFNRHMNTLRYVELMLDEMPIDFAAGEFPVRCDLHFLKETLYGQSLDVLCFVVPEELENVRSVRDVVYSFALRRDDGNLAVLARFSGC